MLAGDIERVHSEWSEDEISFHIDVVVSDRSMIEWLVVLIVLYVSGGVDILFYNCFGFIF